MSVTLSISCSLPLLKHKAHYSFNFINSHNSEGGGQQKTLSPRGLLFKTGAVLSQDKGLQLSREEFGPGLVKKGKKSICVEKDFSFSLSPSLSLMT